MSEIEFVRWIEIPVRYFCELEPAEGDGWNSPHYPAHVEINDIEICLYEDDTKAAKSLKDLKDSILADKVEMDLAQMEAEERI